LYLFSVLVLGKRLFPSRTASLVLSW
jgi:hypothetical protein